jgi:hypothetical protein
VSNDNVFKLVQPFSQEPLTINSHARCWPKPYSSCDPPVCSGASCGGGLFLVNPGGASGPGRGALPHISEARCLA